MVFNPQFYIIKRVVSEFCMARALSLTLENTFLYQTEIRFYTKRAPNISPYFVVTMKACQKAVRDYRHFIFVLLIKSYISLNLLENGVKRKQSLI